MDERLFYKWLRKCTKVKDPADVARIKAYFESRPGIDEILTQAITDHLGLSDIGRLIQGGATAGSLQTPPPSPQTLPAKKPSFLGRLRIFKKKAEPEEENPEDEDPAEPSERKSPKKMILIGAGVLVLVVAAIFAISYFGGQGAATPDITFDIVPTERTQPTPSSKPPATDQAFWSTLVKTSVPELSPGNLNNQLNAKTAVGIFLMLALSGWAIGEGAVRKKGQNGALFFSIVALLAGWLTVPILIAISKTQVVGWFVVGVLFLAILWAMTASTIKSQNDLSPITVALSLFAASLFYVGTLTVVKAIGALFGLTWAAWTHVTSLGGVLILLMTGRGSNSLLTVLILVLGLLVIFMASKEVGKKHGHWAALVIGVAIIAVFYLSSWGLNSGVNYLVDTQNVSVTVTVVLKVLVPILAWLISLLASVGIGVALGDVEVGRSENRQRIGLEKTGTFVQNIADFGILGTIIPLFLGVIIVL